MMKTYRMKRSELGDHPEKGWAARECAHCGAAMLTRLVAVLTPHTGWTTKGPSRFCGSDCEREHERRARRDYMRVWMRRHRPSRAKEVRGVVCAVCGSTFSAVRSDAKYCGGTCRQRARRIRDN